ncbi:MAG TPA: M48 family metalloprotease [Candidatus Acidoferrum sp.]|nr:M48 family metalloprotease [Candidatus Acidoferrum sp.]
MYSAIAANKRKTWFIMAMFIVIIGALGWAAGYLYGDPNIWYFVLIAGGIYALIQYFMAAKLATALNDAHEVGKDDQPRFYRTVENLSIAAGIPVPKLYVIDDPAPNAFATGRDPNHAIVCATSGLLEMMDDSELQAVLAHELGHVRNYDIRVMMIVFALVSAIGIISDIMLRMMWFGGGRGNRRSGDGEANALFMVVGLVVAILAPFAALLVQLAVSRRREYLADSSSALLTRYPEGLERALEKIRDHGSVMKHQNSATAHLFFANPLKSGSLAGLFSTHPPIDDRIAALKAMENKL